MCFEEDFKDSVFDFLRVVKPTLLEQQIIKGEIISIEEMIRPEYRNLLTQFDQLAGIDIFVVASNEGITTMSSRIQWHDTSYDTFTIRKSRNTGAQTEYNKRLKAIQSGKWLYPYYAIQAYLTKPKRKGSLIALAVTHTKDIIDMIQQGNYEEGFTPNDRNTFCIVKWQDMIKAGHMIRIYKPIEVKTQ